MTGVVAYRIEVDVVMIAQTFDNNAGHLRCSTYYVSKRSNNPGGLTGPMTISARSKVEVNVILIYPRLDDIHHQQA